LKEGHNEENTVKIIKNSIYKTANLGFCLSVVGSFISMGYFFLSSVTDINDIIPAMEILFK